MRISDWSSDVCSSDLHRFHALRLRRADLHHGLGDQHDGVIVHGLDERGEALGLGFRGADDRPLVTIAGTDQCPFPKMFAGLESLGGVLRQVRPCVMERDEVVPIRDCGAILRSEEHTSELQSLMRISYAVFCMKKKTNSFGHNKLHK